MSTERQDAENPHLQGRSAEQADNAVTPPGSEASVRPSRASRLKALLEQGRRHRFGPEALPANLSAPFIRRPVATALLTFAIALAGIVAFGLLPVAPLPQVDFPVVDRIIKEKDTVLFSKYIIEKNRWECYSENGMQWSNAEVKNPLAFWKSW